MQNRDWETAHYAWFCNNKCEYFPCHKGVSEDAFNCLFCYCPLYALGKECGGNYRYINNIKDCTNCVFPHIRDNYEEIVKRFSEIVALAAKQEK